MKMKKTVKFAWLAAIALTGTVAFTGCTSSDELPSNVVVDQNGNLGVKPEFVISLPRTVVSGTRMSNEVTQNEGSVNQFRGLDYIRLFSFGAEPTATSTKLSDILRLSAITTLGMPGAINYKVYADQFVPVGTSNFLFYGKAIDNTAEEAITTMDDKFKFGILNTYGLEESEFKTPSDIVFSLERINTSNERQANNEVGKAIVTLLASIANTTASGVAAPDNAWKTTTNKILAPLYKNFIGITTGSSNSLAVMLSDLYNSLAFVQSTDAARPLADAIKAKIEAACTSTPPVSGGPASLKSQYAGYPANIGLPDGAARIRWNVTGTNPNTFVDITGNYWIGNRFDNTKYAYPAALWYYVNTPLKASTEKESPDYDSAGNWEGVINSVYNGAASVVENNTQSVALQLPVQYGVGRIETKITMPAGVFYDGNGEEVSIGEGYTLTGMLIGGQSSVGYDFVTLGNENLTIYDKNMASSTIIAKPNSTTATANQTLALQTKTNQVVYAALELRNGGDAFMGADGTIPAGGTFYLTAKLDPTTASNYQSGVLDKIVMQDHVTKLTITIKNGETFADRNGDGIPDVYIVDPDTGVPTGVDVDGDGTPDPYDIDGDGTPDTFITDPDHGGPGWDTDGDGEVDVPILPNADGTYPDGPNVPGGLGNATNGVPDLSSPGIEIGTSVNLEWQEGLILEPEI